ncbi:hypothetical protein GCM10020358_62380 [Amorphoplanes nipponensis]|uniref:Uncharacterized protein n=1 Tax=Actinoplanes nipponensis TaxID=135950 RepID=A0A919JML7_9ACTN|nr:hypothetical protein [Actinoplanes nipponensis]GIE51972.1 hypothetical protein Ani05nite_55060 [Actinoplanes nipponensis]
MTLPAKGPWEDFGPLRDRARDAVAAIARAGLPARLVDQPGTEGPAAGVNAWLERADDGGADLFFVWEPDPELHAASRRAVEALDLGSPDLRFASEVTVAMRGALRAILSAAGFAAVDPPDISGAQVLIRLPRV